MGSPDSEPRYWNEVGAAWSDQRRQTLWRRHSDAVNRAWLDRHLRELSLGRVLKTDLFDEACTTGLYPSLSAVAVCVVGIDLSRPTLQAAVGHQPLLRVAQTDVRKLPFADAVFDAVISNSTLDHFGSEADILTALQELQRVLRPGGRLLVSLDNPANPFVALRNALPFRLLKTLGLVPYQVGQTCGPQRLHALLCNAGFVVSDIGVILHCPRVFAVALAAVLERAGSQSMQQRFLELLQRFERLAGWRTRFRSGYFVTAVAHKA